MKKQSLKQPLRESLIKIGGGHLLNEVKDEIFRYKDALEGYLKQLRPNIRGWKFHTEHMTGSWYWENRKFEDIIYATWGWEGRNEIPLETSDGIAFKAAKLKLPAQDTTDEKALKKNAKKYIDTMKRELPKIEKKLLEY